MVLVSKLLLLTVGEPVSMDIAVGLRLNVFPLMVGFVPAPVTRTAGPNPAEVSERVLAVRLTDEFPLAIFTMLAGMPPP